MKAEIPTSDGKIEVDFSEMEKRLGDKASVEMKRYFEELKTVSEAKKEANGKGIVEAFEPDRKAKLVEEFQKGERCDAGKIKEQWTICVPKFAQYELAGHLRDFVWVTDAVKGKPGETVNIPYVKDVEFTHETTPHTGGSLTGVTGLINVLTTTLHESGAYYDAYYGDIEKIDSNMLDELNRVFAHAAIRAEDKDLIALINTAVTGFFTSKGGDTETAPFFVGTNASQMNANFVVDALGALMRRGHEVHPGECILILRPKHWAALVKNVIGTTSLSASKPSVAQQGVIEDLLGVKIVVTGYPTYWHPYNQNIVSSYEFAYLLRPKRALALAPKRDILIETDKLIKERQLRIAASHTYGVCAVDLTEVMCIKTGSCPGAGGG
jgi:hypothetical protein